MKKYPEQVYRIYTEDVRRKEIIKATAELFDNFTLHPTTGFFNGQAEKSIVIEIVKATDANIERLAHKIQELNGQKTMLVMSLTGTASVKHAKGSQGSDIKSRRALRSKPPRKAEEARIITMVATHPTNFSEKGNLNSPTTFGFDVRIIIMTMSGAAIIHSAPPTSSSARIGFMPRKFSAKPKMVAPAITP